MWLSVCAVEILNQAPDRSQWIGFIVVDGIGCSLIEIQVEELIFSLESLFSLASELFWHLVDDRLATFQLSLASALW